MQNTHITYSPFYAIVCNVFLCLACNKIYLYYKREIYINFETKSLSEFSNYFRRIKHKVNKEGLEDFDVTIFCSSVSHACDAAETGHSLNSKSEFQCKRQLHLPYECSVPSDAYSNRISEAREISIILAAMLRCLSMVVRLDVHIQNPLLEP